MTSSLGSINLLKGLTELRETFFFLDFQFIVKGYNSGTARWKTHIGQEGKRGTELPCPFRAGDPPQMSPCSPRSSLNPVLLGFYRGFLS